MSKRRNKRMIYVNTALKIAPFLLIIGGCTGFVINSFSAQFKDELQYQELLDNVVNENIIEDVEIINNEIVKPEKDLIAVIENSEIEPVNQQVTSSELLESDYEFQNIDFDKLNEINEDSCAWISVDGTNINLPVVHGEDNEYYLHHDMEGNESKYGTLFVDYRNNPLDVLTNDLSDFTIIYGHHMANGKMLAQICNYKSQSYYDNHPFGIVYTPDGYAYEAEFFAGVIIDGDDESKIFTESIKDEESYKAYIENIRENSTFESDVEVEYGDKVLVLVTCSYETTNSRYVLYAVLNKQYTNENQMTNERKLTLNL